MPEAKSDGFKEIQDFLGSFRNTSLRLFRTANLSGDMTSSEGGKKPSYGQSGMLMNVVGRYVFLKGVMSAVIGHQALKGRNVSSKVDRVMGYM